jgi:hypothetical protein
MVTALLKGVEKDTPMVATVLGTLHKEHPVLGAAVGLYLGKGIARDANRKSHAINLSIISEVSGRPKLAKMLVSELKLHSFRKNPLLYSQLLRWGEHGPKMSKYQREQFVLKNKTVEDLLEIDIEGQSKRAK